MDYVASKKILDQKSVSTPKVLLVGNGLRGGGAETRLARLVSRLYDGRNDVAVLSGDLLSNASRGGKSYCLQWTGRLSYLLVVRRLRRIIGNGQYDAVMAFGLFSVAVSALAMIGMRNRPKFIVSEITRPIASAEMLSFYREFVYYLMRRVFYKSGNLITANSVDGLIETCQMLGTDPALCVRLPNIVDVDGLAINASRDLPCAIPSDRYVVCVGRLTYSKRINTVLESFGVLSGTIDCSLVIVGDGEARHALESQVEAFGMEQQVVFTGELDNPFPVLARAAAFVLASEYEGFSNSVLEAMFCDIPVITSFCSSDARDMCNYGAALGFEIGDYEQLAEHIAAAVNSDTLILRLVQRAREYRKPHAAESAIPFYEDLIRRVVNDSGAIQGRVAR